METKTINPKVFFHSVGFLSCYFPDGLKVLAVRDMYFPYNWKAPGGTNKEHPYKDYREVLNIKIQKETGVIVVESAPIHKIQIMEGKVLEHEKIFFWIGAARNLPKVGEIRRTKTLEVSWVPIHEFGKNLFVGQRSAFQILVLRVLAADPGHPDFSAEYATLMRLVRKPSYLTNDLTVAKFIFMCKKAVREAKKRIFGY